MPGHRGSRTQVQTLMQTFATGRQIIMNRRRLIMSLSAVLAGCGSGIDPPPTNLAFDGNSLTYGFMEAPPGRVSKPYPSQIVAAPKNYAVSGVTWDEMAASSEVDDAMVAGAHNTLVAWETTNTACIAYAYGRDYVSANALGATTYLQARRAAGWNRIILLSSIPREALLAAISDEQKIVMNGALLACDDDMAVNYLAYGATDYLNLRWGPLDFIGNGWTFGGNGSGFDALASIYGDGGFWLPSAQEPPGHRIHLADGGYALIAQLVKQRL